MAANPAHSDGTHSADAASGGLPQFAFETWTSQIFWLVITFGASCERRESQRS